MPKELYIYSPLYDFTAERVVSEMNKVSNDEELTIRINTPGGNVNSGWSVISKLSERNGKTNMVVDGQAASFGAIMLMFADKVIANDTSDIMFHKAAYPTWYEPTQEEQDKLDEINNTFKSKLKKKLGDRPGAKELMSKIFQKDVRNDVRVKPKEAKKLGIVDQVRTLEPSAFDFNIQVVALKDEADNIIDFKVETPSGENNNSNNGNMDLAKLKAEHPAVYQAAFAEGETSGIEKGEKKERDRVEAWAVFNEVNPEKVKQGIESGKQITQKAMAEFSLEMQKSEIVKGQQNDNPGEIDTQVDAKTEEELKAEKNKKAMDDLFGKKEEDK